MDIRALRSCYPERKTSDSPDNCSQTPILWATRNGHEAVVELLLGQKDVNSDRPNKRCQTPISRDIRNGYRAVANLIRGQKDTNVDRDNTGGLPYSRILLKSLAMVS